jgi:hypothetical protein
MGEEEEMLEDFAEIVSDELRETTKQKGSELSKEEIMEEVSRVYQEKIDIAQKRFEKESSEYEKIIRNLQNKLEALEVFSEDRGELQIKKGWDKEQNVERIIIDFYTIEVKTQRGKCKYCYYFKKQGYVQKLRSLYRLLEIDREKYVFNEWRVDYQDRYLTNEVTPEYDNNLSVEGMNWFYAVGNGIEWFPSIDIQIEFSKGHISDGGSISSRRSGTGHNPVFKRLLGMGRLAYYCEKCDIQLSSEEIHIEDDKKKCIGCKSEVVRIITFGRLLEGIVGYILNRDEAEINRKIYSHQISSESNDLALDRKFAKS